MNERVRTLVDALLADAGTQRVVCRTVGGARVVDCGVAVPGGLGAGLVLARVCLAELASVALVPSPVPDLPGLGVQVVSDQPLRACLGAQYAGWRIAVGDYFAMGSGPMRAKYGHEDLYREHPDWVDALEGSEWAFGVLETRELPTETVVADLAGKLAVAPNRLTLLVAPTASLAGTVQVVARTLETALHKLHVLKFDLGSVVSGSGVAPLPPVAHKDRIALGWTNDAVLYGGEATLWVNAEDDALAEVGPRVPSAASSDHGTPFGELFERAGRDFYKMDPLLFSPARVVFHNLRSGRTHTFGRLAPEVLRRSYGL